MNIVIWLDDERNPEDPQWFAQSHRQNATTIWVKTYEEFVVAFDTYKNYIVLISFDNDLGAANGKEGYHAFTYVEAISHVEGWFPCNMECHSANPPAVRRINAGIHKLVSFWEESWE